MGDLIRHQIASRGTAEEKWDMVADLVSKGEMAPEVSDQSAQGCSQVYPTIKAAHLLDYLPCSIQY